MTAHDPALMKRRTFLKGIFAAGAAPIIAPELFADVTAPAVVHEIPGISPSLPKTASYELWLSDGRKWRMVGMVRAVAVERPVVEVPGYGLAMYREFEPGPERFLSMDVLQDAAGVEDMRAIMESADDMEIIFASPHGNYRSGLVIAGVDWEFNHAGINADIRGQLIGEAIYYA